MTVESKQGKAMRSLITCFLLALMVPSLGLRSVSGFDYGDALQKSLMFFEAQRSGKLPTDQSVKWRGNSGLTDGFLQGVDLVGGYYDAGDHVKFGLPMAFAVTMLSWGAVDFMKEIAACNQLDHTLKAIRWGTDYFIKAHKQPNVLWGQVGDGDSDHYCWERAEDMSTPRTAYKIDLSHPGSDLAGETAAAMAAASIAFKPYDSTYSQLLLVHAKQLFSFADRFRGRYDDSIQVAKQYYPSSSGYSDELLWAAAWLFRATGDEYYLKYVVENAASMGGTGWAVREFSWDNKYAGVQVLLAKVLMDGVGGAYTSTLKQYQAKAEFFLCACLQKNNGYNVEVTPGGLLYVDNWNNMQYVSSASFLMAIYSSYLSKDNAELNCPDAKIQPLELLKFAQSQADYILGKNPKSMSYLVGFGASYPVQVHHRGASIESITLLPSKVGCIDGFEKWYNLNEGNPNVIIGALVGGPDQKDDFSDRRGNYEQTEPSLASNAPLSGLFAKLKSVFGNSGPTSKYSPTTQSVPTPHYTTTSITGTTAPFQFIHSITNKWTVGSTTYYRHKVIVKNMSQKTISKLKLRIEGLSGSVWGLSPCPEKNTFELPPWMSVLKPDSQFSFVYVQEGPQAKVSVLSYNRTFPGKF